MSQQIYSATASCDWKQIKLIQLAHKFAITYEEHRRADLGLELVLSSSDSALAASTEMSLVDVLPAHTAGDFELDRPESKLLRSPDASPDSGARAIISCISPTSSHVSRPFHNKHEGHDDVLIPDMPPLLRGHPEVHLRNGVKIGRAHV